MKKESFWSRLGARMPIWYGRIMCVVLVAGLSIIPAFAVNDMWTVARTIIVDLYNKIAGISILDHHIGIQPT